MDSKLIYIKAQHLINEAMFGDDPFAGWMYCGRSDDFRTALVSKYIDEHFPEKMIYFVLTRYDSGIKDKAEIIPLITTSIDSSGFALWNEDFSKVIEFKPIGVFRVGCHAGRKPDNT